MGVCKENKANMDANPNQSIEPAETIEVNAKKNPRVSVNRNAKTLCKQCGLLVTGQLSCCGKDGSWQGSCVPQYESKVSVDKNKLHTWAEGIDACNARVLRSSSKVADVGFSESEDPQIKLEIDSARTVSATSHEKNDISHWICFSSDHLHERVKNTRFNDYSTSQGIGFVLICIIIRLNFTGILICLIIRLSFVLICL